LSHKKLKSKDNLITIIFGLALLFGLSQNIPGPLIPVFVEEFDIGFDQMGLILFVGLFFGMIAAIIFGQLSDRYGRKLIISIGIGLLSLGVAGIVLSFSSVFFTISYSLMNFGFGCLEAGITTGIAELGEDNRSHMLTGFTKFTGLGSFVGPIILFLLLYFGIWWRVIFIIVFISLIILLLFLLRIDYPKPYHHNKPGDRLKFRDFMNPVVITGAFVLFFHNGVIMMAGSWLTTYFATFGVLVKYSSIIVAFYWLSILIGRILTQRIIKKMDEKLFLIIAGFLSTIALAAIAFTENIIIKIIFSLLLGLFIGGIFPILLSILFSTGPKIIGRIFSFLGFVGYGSVMVFQLLTGYFVENFGKESVIYIQFANSVLCLIFILLMVRSSKILKERLKNK